MDPSPKPSQQKQKRSGAQSSDRGDRSYSTFRITFQRGSCVVILIRWQYGYAGTCLGGPKCSPYNEMIQLSMVGLVRTKRTQSASRISHPAFNRWLQTSLLSHEDVSSCYFRPDSWQVQPILNVADHIMLSVSRISWVFLTQFCR